MIPEGNPTREDRADKGRSLRAEGHGGLTFLRGLKSSKANCPNVSLWETWHRCHVPSNPIQPIGWPTATEKFGVAVGQAASCGLANCHREIWGGSWPGRKLWPGQLPPHLCQRDFPRFTAARVSLQSVCQDAQGHRGSDREWLKSRCPGLPRQRETGCRKLATAGCDRLSQARGRWLRQAVASSRPLVATGSRNLEAAGCDRLSSQARGRWLRQAVGTSRPLVATGCRNLEAAGCDRLSQARNRWLRQAVASSQWLKSRSWAS